MKVESWMCVAIVLAVACAVPASDELGCDLLVEKARAAADRGDQDSSRDQFLLVLRQCDSKNRDSALFGLAELARSNPGSCLSLQSTIDALGPIGKHEYLPAQAQLRLMWACRKSDSALAQSIEALAAVRSAASFGESSDIAKPYVGELVMMGLAEWEEDFPSALWHFKAATERLCGDTALRSLVVRSMNEEHHRPAGWDRVDALPFLQNWAAVGIEYESEATQSCVLDLASRASNMVDAIPSDLASEILAVNRKLNAQAATGKPTKRN